MNEFDIFVTIKAEEYLRRNPERFNASEKAEFRKYLSIWLADKEKPAEDEVFDFAISEGIALNANNRVDTMISYLNGKYKCLTFRKILDVGAGRLCKLSVALAKYGCEMHAIDPNIRLTQQESKKLGIKSISTNKFICDEYSKSGKGTGISKYSQIVGLEPCQATEHIIRQSLKYDIPFDLLLCSCPQTTLKGNYFQSCLDWYEYLQAISSEVSIDKIDGHYYATNNKVQIEQMER